MCVYCRHAFVAFFSDKFLVQNLTVDAAEYAALENQDNEEVVARLAALVHLLALIGRRSRLLSIIVWGC